MAAEDALLQACRWAPDDDAPRLVWADAVGGERGELVVIQCDLARGDLPPAEAGARRRRERELIARHGAAWAALGALGVEGGGFEFRRGFVEAIELDARTFAAHGEEIFARAPLLRSLTAVATVPSGDPLGGLRRLLEAPAFWRLHGLDLVGVGIQTGAFDYDPGFDGYGDEAARLLVESSALAQLDALGITASGLTAAGAHHLVASGELPHLQRLWLRNNDLGGDAIVAVLGRAPRLRALDLHGELDLGAIVPALPPVAELHLWGIDDEALAALGESRAAATLEALRLSFGSLARTDGWRALPRLRELDLRGPRLDDPERGARDLAALPALRRLRLPSGAPASALRRLARELGPRLEELDVSGAMCEARVIDELEADVAGVVVRDGPHGHRLLL